MLRNALKNKNDKKENNQLTTQEEKIINDKLQLSWCFENEWEVCGLWGLFKGGNWNLSTL